MKPQELMTLALRVLAVFIASEAFMYLAEAATFWALPPDHQGGMDLTALSTAWLLGPSIAAVSVWVGAPALARLACRGMHNEIVVSITAQSAVGAAFVVTGTVTFLLGLINLTADIGVALDQPHSVKLWWFIGGTMKCVLGAGLAIGSKATARFLLGLRYAGTGAE